jgi:hypothetical protein
LRPFETISATTAMARLDDIPATLSEPSAWSYRPGGPAAVEPISLALLALVGYGKTADAGPALEELLKLQATDGSFGVYAGEPAEAPHWTTAFAVVAMVAVEPGLPSDDSRRDRVRAAVVAADKFLLDGIPSTVFDKSDEVSHNTLLHGWPWVAGTHSWLEPTAMALLALKASGMRGHRRCSEAVELLVDRLLPDGGCNHGNTFVLGQKLVPHVQPTGIVMLALAGENVNDPRLNLSLEYLARTIDASTTAASLSYALLGLAAHGRLVSNGRPAADARKLLEGAIAKPTFELGASVPRRSLVALAALGEQSPLVKLSREGTAP